MTFANASILASLPLSAPREGEPYGRTLLSLPKASHELLAMRWRSGARCAPHDHGESEGTIQLIEGSFIERRFEFEEGELRVSDVYHYESPAVIPMDRWVIHDMVAPEGGLSLHRYSTPIKAMRVWDVAKERVLTVADDCGAWVPSNPAQVVSWKPWNELR